MVGRVREQGDVSGSSVVVAIVVRGREGGIGVSREERGSEGEGRRGEGIGIVEEESIRYS